jgi:DNA-binding transcriptional MerR regulator
MKEPRTLSPRELAESAGISTDTLRYYERRGVLPRPARTQGGYRRYPPAAVARVAMIRRALAIGFSIADLSRVLREREQGGAPCRRVRAIVSARLSRIDAELAALSALKHDLVQLLEDWDAKLAATPVNTQARLLESLSGPAQPFARKSSAQG